VAKALKDLGSLKKFFTSSYITSEALQVFLIKSGNTFWTRRFLEGLSGNDVASNWSFELKEMLLAKIFGQSERTLNAVYERDVKFDHYVSGKIGRIDCDIFWGFQGSCLQSLLSAKRSSKISVCELATGHAPSAVRLLQEEKNLNPEWADSIDNVSFPDSYFERLRREPHEADFVVAASSFTLRTLREDGVPESKLHLLPLGFELDHIPYTEQRRTRKPGAPIKLLYAGRLTQRKGVKYLLDAMNEFDPEEVELHMIGHIQGSGKGLSRYKNYIHHSPLPQYELFKMYQEFDAFVLPSIFEGFGLVLVEAMAAGLPIITTSHSIGPEIVENDKNGYLVPIRSSAEIASAIRKYLGKSEEERFEMKRNARETALKYSWDEYKLRLDQVLKVLSVTS
jgi:alpha-maltose-1-phosphate synthase